jgi:cytochrome c oxidase assembly protein subunit 11
MTERSPQDELKAKNKRVAIITTCIVVGMIALSYASVPLYNLFCRVTGFGGTTQVTDKTSDIVLDRIVTVNFDTTVNPQLPWSFASEVRRVQINVGQDMLVNFKARNTSSVPVAGTAIYNVTPNKVGKYFNKIQCFCFDEQTLQPGQNINMPVLFYIDPAMNDDPYMDDVTSITLSYTFFKAESEELENAVINYGETP